MLVAALTMLLAAAPPPSGGVTIAWEGPAECGDGTTTRAMVDRLVGAPRADLEASATVSIVAERTGWIAEIAIEHDGATSQRRLRGAPCTALNDAVALVIAVTVDPLGASATVSKAVNATEAERPGPPVVTVIPGPSVATTDPTPPVPTQAPAPVAVEPLPTTQPRATPASGVGAADRRASLRVPLRGSAFVVGGGTLGLVDPVGGQLGGGLALGVGVARIELAATHRFSTRIDHRAGGGSGADVSLTAARASGCWSLRRKRFIVPVCGGFEVGAWSAQGRGLTNTTTANLAWLAITPHARPMVRATPWLALGVDVQAPLALLRPRFTVDDFEDDLLRVDPAGFRFGLAVEVTFVDTSAR